MEAPRIVILGTGHMARFLLDALSVSGMSPVQLYGRDAAAAARLGQAYDVPVTDRIAEVHDHADLYFLAVSDHAIRPVAHTLPVVEGIVCHCSGAAPLTDLAPHRRTGVFWPLQTLAHPLTPGERDTPVILESDDPQVLATLHHLAIRLTGRAETADARSRLTLHLAAVLVNNFTNHLHALAEKLMETHQLPMELLLPLIRRTAAQAGTAGAMMLQTGPAVRDDQDTIRRHLELIQDDQDLFSVYETITRSIREMHQNKRSSI